MRYCFEFNQLFFGFNTIFPFPLLKHKTYSIVPIVVQLDRQCVISVYSFDLDV